MSVTLDTIENVAANIQSKLDVESTKKRIVLIYAFNGSGKTRLSKIIEDSLTPEIDSEGLKVLSYNAFFEDLFTWNNENYIFNFNPNNDVIKFIIDQGLENQITDNFQKLTLSKISPSYDLTSGKITFSFLPGDDRSQENIKISRGEESLFIWSVFFTVLESAFLALSSEKENRETELFNGLEYIIIDDPVSSIDDTKIITMTIELIKVINSLKDNNLKFLVTTHHALFYNILHNEYKRNSDFKPHLLVLSKNNSEFKLVEQGDTPFAYHLAVKNEIKMAIDNGELKKYHFNLLRGLLEKTANFLGYDTWSDCLEGDDKKEMTRLVNIYSHGRLSDLESTDIPDEHKELFKKIFINFIEKFKWK